MCAYRLSIPILHPTRTLILPSDFAFHKSEVLSRYKVKGNSTGQEGSTTQLSKYLELLAERSRRAAAEPDQVFPAAEPDQPSTQVLHSCQTFHFK